MTTSTITRNTMTTASTSHPVRDSITMIRRNLKHIARYPSLTLTIIGIPVIFLLLFVFLFGETLGDGLGGVEGGRSAYATYVTPGVILLAVAGAAQATAIAVATDMTEGIIARFRTMAIARVSVLTGHVVGSMFRTGLCMVVVIAVALLVGFRPTANVVEWLAAAGVLGLITLAVTWLSVALGLASRTVENSSNLPMPLLLLPFLGSGFVPTESMPAWLRIFADYQPFTPVMETLRGLLLGGPIGNDATLAVLWCVGITLLSYGWARWLYNRDPVR